MGLGIRGPGQFGTTILVVDADVDLTQIVCGVEDWWWPRLIEHRLDVEVIDDAGNLSLPRPRKNDQLRPFIEAFDVACQRAEPKAGAQKYNRLNSFEDTPLGACGFVVGPLGEEGPIVPADRGNTVALIRAPLMVVAYKSFSETSPMVVGAYLASEEVDLVLKKSEPPAHDRWDPDSTNLRDEKGAGKELVRAILSRIKSGLKRFQSEAAPPASAKQRRLSMLERALASYFRSQSRGPGDRPEVEASPLHLQFTRQPYAEATDRGMLRLKGAFTVVLDDGADEDEVDLAIRIRCPVLEDDSQEGDDLSLKVDVKGVSAKSVGGDGHVYRFTLAKGDKARFRIESEPYDPAWSVRLRPEIDRETAE